MARRFAQITNEGIILSARIRSAGVMRSYELYWTAEAHDKLEAEEIIATLDQCETAKETAFAEDEIAVDPFKLAFVTLMERVSNNGFSYSNLQRHKNIE